MKRALVWLGALALAFAVRHASAAPRITCCSANYGRVSSGSLAFKWSTNSFGSAPGWTNQFGLAAQSWTNLAQSTVSITTQQDVDGINVNNSESEIWFTTQFDVQALAIAAIIWNNPGSGLGSCNSNLQACTAPSCSGCSAPSIAAVDIVFFEKNNGTTISWSTSTPTGSNTVTRGLGSTYVGIVATHEMGHAIGLEHTNSGGDRMTANHPNGGWFNGTISSISTPPLADDSKWAHLIYPTTTSYSAFYARNVRTLNGQSTELSADNEGGSEQHVWPDNLTTAVRNSSDNHAKRGETVQWMMCYGNRGTTGTGSITITATLSTSPTTMGTLPFGSMIFSGGFGGHSQGCTVMTVWYLRLPRSERTTTSYSVAVLAQMISRVWTDAC